ncbi:hypothetical protein V9T40_000205 [Parthenolecanium corni]|uniref:Uncharacterized protein n=1 Tax=Parthenolecanium corni TaxID=536013 RepID=A0AAN9TAM6_9HEMI
MSQEDTGDSAINKMVSLIIERSKSGSANLSNPTLAEKVEPGYLVRLASEIENANNFVFHAACGQLKIIEEQMNSLRKRALRILIDTKLSSTLNSLPCNFSKIPGHVYSVYQKPDSTYYISMISPEEWSYNSPHRFVGSYKFESCMKWSPVDENSASSAILCWIRNDEEENFTLADASANLGI